uniref:Uncharacterized protein n=1 Tax=viral metagenome TaxID=1070528 RepID=A0A6C0H9E3_9ZZZZ
MKIIITITNKFIIYTIIIINKINEVPKFLNGSKLYYNFLLY